MSLFGNIWNRWFGGRTWYKPWRRRDDWLETYNRDVVPVDPRELHDLNK